MSPSVEYASGGGRALVELHERELRAFLPAWREARARGLALPKTADPSYASYEALLAHVLRAARSYMTWMCETLGLPDPDIRPAPEVDRIAAEADGYVDHLLERWRVPLVHVGTEALEHTERPCRWGPTYCVDAMLEHAVMHPLRHRYQLEQALARRGPR